MPIYRDKNRGCFVFEFDRYFEGRRVRTRKHLPKTWNKSQADAFERQESARLYAIATKVERAEYSIEEAVDVYVKERLPLLKTGKNVTKELALMFFAYQGRPITALPDACKFYVAKATRENDDNKQPLSPASLRNRIRYLVAACRYAWKKHNMCEQDPAARVIIPTVKNERQEYISRLEMITIVRACCNWNSRRAFRIAFYSGMRLSEVRKYTVRAGTFVLADTKNGEPRNVPIHPKIASAVAQFDQKIAKITIQRAFTRTVRQIGMGHLHLHDLRHSAASELINAGVDLYTVGRVLGHKDSRSTQRYAHLAVGTLADAIGKIGRRVA